MLFEHVCFYLTTSKMSREFFHGVTGESLAALVDHFEDAFVCKIFMCIFDIVLKLYCSKVWYFVLKNPVTVYLVNILNF